MTNPTNEQLVSSTMIRLLISEIVKLTKLTESQVYDIVFQEAWTMHNIPKKTIYMDEDKIMSFFEEIIRLE